MPDGVTFESLQRELARLYGLSEEEIKVVEGTV